MIMPLTRYCGFCFLFGADVAASAEEAPFVNSMYFLLHCGVFGVGSFTGVRVACSYGKFAI